MSKRRLAAVLLGTSSTMSSRARVPSTGRCTFQLTLSGGPAPAAIVDRTHEQLARPGDEGAVHEGGVGGGQSVPGAPDGAARGGVDGEQGVGEDAGPGQVGAEDGATEAVQDEQLDAVDDLGGDVVVAQPGDEGGDGARVGGGLRDVLVHWAGE